MHDDDQAALKETSAATGSDPSVTTALVLFAAATVLLTAGATVLGGLGAGLVTLGALVLVGAVWCLWVASITEVAE